MTVRLEPPLIAALSAASLTVLVWLATKRYHKVPARAMPALILTPILAGLLVYKLISALPLPDKMGPDLRTFLNSSIVLIAAFIVGAIVLMLLVKFHERKLRRQQRRMARLFLHHRLLAIRFHPRLGGKLSSAHEAIIAEYRRELKELPTFEDDPVYGQ